MESFWESNYRENLQNLREAADELVLHMKGYDWSFRREITDKNGAFSQEKLCALVDEMLSLWAQDLQNGRYEDVAEPYLGARLGLYRAYLYAAMRCSLCKGAYSDARGGAGEQERTDFSFLLKQAKQLSRDWCVLAGPDGTRRNELYWGYDRYFGFHLYRPFNEFASGNKGMDWALTPDYLRACDQPDSVWTNEGNMRLISIQHLSQGPLKRPAPEETDAAEKPEAPDDPTEQEAPAFPEEDLYDAGEDLDDLYACAADCDPADEADEDFRLFADEYDAELQWARLEQYAEEDAGAMALHYLWKDFDCVTEYLSACESFRELFGRAAPEVVRSFYEDLETIVDLYLFRRGIPPLMDVDKSLNVYGCIRDGALRQAKRYGRGIQWNSL